MEYPPILIRDARYPLGRAVLLAWDAYQLGPYEFSTYLVRINSSEYYIHYVAPRIAPYEVVVPVTPLRAMITYAQLTVRVASVANSFPDSLPIELIPPR